MNVNFAVSEEIEDGKNLAEEFKVLEGMLGRAVLSATSAPDFSTGRSRKRRKLIRQKILEIMEQITKDIQYKDLPHLRQDFQRLEEKISCA